MNLGRTVRLIRKFAGIAIKGWRPSSIVGRLTGPRVIINSVPKSGTNLVQEVLHQFPLLHGSITRTLTSELDERYLVKRIASIRRGEVIPAHIFYSNEIARVMRDRDIKMIFVIRDFRDAMLSHINYIDKMDVSHPHHAVFSRFSTLDDKIDACLYGVPGEFQSWPSLVRGFRGWVGADNVMLVSFEDLIGTYGGGNNERQRATILKMAHFLKIELTDVNAIVRNMYNQNGLTFNAPEIGKWQREFDAAQIRKINACLLDDINYFSRHGGAGT